MKPQRFEIGQAVTPKRGAWTPMDRNLPGRPPKMDIYHVSEYHTHRGFPDLWFISLDELPLPTDPKFDEDGFDPVITDSELESLLNSVPETQTVEV